MKTKLSRLFIEFFDSERASGIVLIACTLTSILIANSLFGKGFIDFWHLKVGFDAGFLALHYSVEHWVNDALMAIFFLLIGLEIEREIYIGELSDLKNASLPIFAAIGGMAIPALFYFLINRGTGTQNGFGIPMATDIAFALGVLALLGNRIPASLKVFLTALAIIDDLGAILMIAIFYVGDFSLLYLVLSLAVFAGLIVLNRLGVNSLAAVLNSWHLDVVFHAPVRCACHTGRCSAGICSPVPGWRREIPFLPAAAFSAQACRLFDYASLCARKHRDRVHPGVDK